jgi:hypothetical protein
LPVRLQSGPDGQIKLSRGLKEGGIRIKKLPTAFHMQNLLKQVIKMDIVVCKVDFGGINDE